MGIKNLLLIFLAVESQKINNHKAINATLIKKPKLSFKNGLREDSRFHIEIVCSINKYNKIKQDTTIQTAQLR